MHAAAAAAATAATTMTTKQHRTSFITTKFLVLFFAGPTWLPLFLAYNLCARRPKAASYKPQTYFPPNM